MVLQQLVYLPGDDSVGNAAADHEFAGSGLFTMKKPGILGTKVHVVRIDFLPDANGETMEASSRK